MREELEETVSPQPGDLALYTPRHVVIVESFDPSTGNAIVIGENGGGPSCTSVERALELDARAKRETGHLYRDGFVGFRSIREWGVDDLAQPLEQEESRSSIPIIVGVGVLALLGVFILRR